MLHKPGNASSTDLKSELDRLHNNVSVLRDTQPPDRTDQFNNESREQHHQQLNHIYQRFQHHNNQQHSEPQHSKEDTKISKPRNSQSLTSSSQHLKTAAMQLTNAAHHHHNHHMQMYQRACQQIVTNGFTAAAASSPATVDNLLLQNHSTSHPTPQSQASKPSFSSSNPQFADLKFSSTCIRESQPVYAGTDKQQPFLRNHPSSSFARNQLISHQLQENDLHPKLGHSSNNTRQDQQERESNEIFAIDRQLNNLDLGDFKEDGEEEEEEEEVSKEFETLSSLEKNLPVELSFLIRQQAYCTAKMNYLERQIRELKETCQPTTAPNENQNYAAHFKYGGGINRLASNNHTITPTAAVAKLNVHSKNGNFIPSDDSGGEYSRATMSDDDELSSLLDQIAKSIRPDRCQSIRNSSQFQHHELQQQLHHQQPLQHLHQQQYHQQQLHQSLLSSRVNYGVYGNAQQQQAPLPPQQYTFINPGQLHHQAVPVFVMSSPITVAPHPSSINSSVMAEVHFQPEPRYNQYYEDFYMQQHQNNNNPPSSTPNRQNGIRSRQFDGNLLAGSSVSEQLGATSSQQQREKRQIKSQLKSSDNWLKMRSPNLCNMRGSTTNSGNDKNCNGMSSRQLQQVALASDTSETTNQNSATAVTTTVPLATATSATAAIPTGTTALANASTTNSSSTEAGSSSSTATEVENLNSVIEESKR